MYVHYQTKRLIVLPNLYKRTLYTLSHTLHNKILYVRVLVA